MKVLVVDDHSLFRQSLVRILRDRWSDWIFLEAGTGPEALTIARATPPELLLLDLNLDKESGLQVLPPLRALVPGLRTLVVSMHRDGNYVAAALRSQVQGFVSKDSSLETLVEAVDTIAAGRTWFDQDQLRQAGSFLTMSSEFSNYRTLTPREQEIFLQLAEGGSTGEVAKRLGRSEKTVDNHRSAIYQKLGVSDRYELFALAKKLGLIL